ncbi:metallophosphoesterase family protein [Sulfitobacter aestuarii]|uniref:Metallophosphoesterase family protein n=1 Tax=Sulfitobacter aestuarii TaxID=2161676 RepID=A0ABW5U150_9RHOB
MFGKWLRKRPRHTSDFAAPSPDSAFIALGDIHGRLDLLERALQNADLPVICVGDYIDRGDQSAEVLRCLQARPEVTCLMGNHEEMMLNFLAQPVRHGPRWLRNGGLQTLASFGIARISDSAEGKNLTAARDALAEALGPELLRWVGTLPTCHRNGNIAILHAGADPQLPIDAQSRDTLLWGHPEFRRMPRSDGIWVLHGHTIVDAPRAQDGVISIDTGAYATGRLTAARIDGEGVSFSSV